MYLARLVLTDFRSYASADLRLKPGVSTLLGANGQGKTNLVEAAAYLAVLSSHRVASDAPLVRRGADRAILRATVTSPGRDSVVEVEINPGRPNRARLNHSPVSRPRHVLGVLRTVMFAPEDLALTKGDPEQRRRFLDDLLVASAPRYAGVRADYERVLRQRTALLKSLRARVGGRGQARGARSRTWPRAAVPVTQHAAGPDAGYSGDMGRDGNDGQPGEPEGDPARTLDVWDEHLVAAGAELMAARMSLTRALQPHVAGAYAVVSGGGGAASIRYRRTGEPAGPGQDPDPGPDPDRASLAEGLRQALARARPEEIERGLCLVGPHRDDLDLRIGNLPARGYASHGESWSMALALRLASYELLRADGDDPVLLLDDVFAELDAGRRERLAGLVAGAEQVLVTAAVPADVPDVLAGARFEVAAGTVTRAA